MSKKAKEDEVAASVLSYLNKQNRPYSAGDVFSNLHGQFGKTNEKSGCKEPWELVDKTAIQKALEQLANQDKVNEKTYGKQKVYGPKQNQYKDYNENDLKQIDEDINKYEKQWLEIQSSCKSLEEEYRSLKSSLTTEEATAKLQELTEQCSKYQEHLKRIKSASHHITPAEKEKIINSHKAVIQTWRKRKRMASDIMNAILENYPKTKKQFIDDVGIETDEEYNVTIPQIR